MKSAFVTPYMKLKVTIVSLVLQYLQTQALALVAAGGMSGLPKTSCTHRDVMELTQYAIWIHLHAYIL